MPIKNRQQHTSLSTYQRAIPVTDLPKVLQNIASLNMIDDNSTTIGTAL